MKSNFALVKFKVLNLSEEERKDLYKDIGKSLGIGSQDDVISTNERNIANFYDIMSKSLDLLIMADTCPYTIFKAKNSGLYKELVELVAEIDRLVRKGFDKIATADRQRFYQVVCTLIIDRVYEMDVPLSRVSFIRTGKGKIAGIVDEAFPGYARSGLLKMVVTAHKNKYQQ